VQFKPEGSIVDVGKGVKIGGPEVVVAAGPCAVESEYQINTIAESVARAGAKILRAGAFKPRSSPYTFQGMGEEGLKLMRTAADRNGLLVVSEVMDPSQVALLMQYVDVLQVGARNMQNYHLLRALGEVRKPVLLKRGLSATIEELLLSAEYIMAGGNYNVILCERGIRTFETSTRNTFDIAAIPVIQKLSHLPIVADPSHGTGRRDKVAPMARAAVAAGGDGLLIEVHHDPEHALSDGAQSLFPNQFAKLMTELRIIAPAVGRRVADNVSVRIRIRGFSTHRDSRHRLDRRVFRAGCAQGTPPRANRWVGSPRRRWLAPKRWARLTNRRTRSVPPSAMLIWCTSRCPPTPLSIFCPPSPKPQSPAR
jgi:3-deoxy-7-phosphoheptulonate synthase